MAKSKIGARDIVTVGLMSALVFAATFIRIEIPTPIGKCMIHMGNVVCILSALLFGPLKGGLSAGIGSMTFDLFDPVFITGFWITFINKFVMALVAGLIYHGAKKRREPSVAVSAAASVTGTLAYLALYLGKTVVESYLILGVEWETVWVGVLTKGSASLVNGIIAAIGSVILNSAMRPALKKAGIYDKMRVR